MLLLFTTLRTSLLKKLGIFLTGADTGPSLHDFIIQGLESFLSDPYGPEMTFHFPSTVHALQYMRFPVLAWIELLQDLHFLSLLGNNNIFPCGNVGNVGNGNTESTRISTLFSTLHALCFDKVLLKSILQAYVFAVSY